MREQPITRAPMRRGREPSMDLPAGWTCGGCGHFKRCNAMFGHIAQDETCDWSPSRFRPSMVTVTRAFEIADEAMIETLESEGHIEPGEDSGDVYRRPPEHHIGRREFDKAVEWLAPRGFVVADETGEFIKVLRRPGDDL